MKIDPNDPRLTAYVLGELDAAEREAIEKQLAECEKSREYVEQLRATTQMLAKELAGEPAPALSVEQRQAVQQEIEKLGEPQAKGIRRPAKIRWWQSPQWMALAASLLVIAGTAAVLGPRFFRREAETRSSLIAKNESSLPRIPASHSDLIARDDKANAEVKSEEASKEPLYFYADAPVRRDLLKAKEQPPAQPEGVEMGKRFETVIDEARIAGTAGDGQIAFPQRTTSSGDILASRARKPSQDTAAGAFSYLGQSAGVQDNFIATKDQDFAQLYTRSLGDIVRAKEDAPTSPKSPGMQIAGSEAQDGLGLSRRAGVARVRGVPASVARNEVLCDLPQEAAPQVAYSDEWYGYADTDNSVLIEKDAEQPSREAYDRIWENPFLRVTHNPLSTFSIDVDTASYANVRRHLNQGQLPPKDAVRIEELINYFSYDYPPPEGRHPFSTYVEVAACPWKEEHRLVRVGLKGRVVESGRRPDSNLVFLLDVSGSMNRPNKLPLVIQSLQMLVDELFPSDRVAIVVYAGASGLVLPSTNADDKETISTALENLRAGGSTNGGQGIELAYRIATENFIKGGTNRVILATDGDFNVGVTNRGDLVRLIEEKAKSGVFLSVLGFGMGNLQDATLEQLADKGNGNYAYIDTEKEAEKVLVEQIGGTLVTIAKDVKIQIEFNPQKVGAYRLIGYENRMLAKEDFNDDTKDAGEIGAGHTVTALYEIIPAGAPLDLPGVDELKYQVTVDLPDAEGAEEILTLKLRYKPPEDDTSRLIEQAVRDSGKRFSETTDDFKFASAVASFGMLLRDSEHKGNATFDRVIETAAQSKGLDEKGYREEFIQLVEKAKGLMGQQNQEDSEDSSPQSEG